MNRLDVSKSGLSPRVRGSPLHTPCPQRSPGSIPACAGEPMGHSIRPIPTSVYPRVCGGAAPTCRRPLPWTRSIPACAGEPHEQPPMRAVQPVYPRVCGGPAHTARLVLPLAGLSPRVRGSRLPVCGHSLLPGSIPACAGEPHVPHVRRHSQPVYPRVCGGANSPWWRQAGDQGLSPRVRGSRGRRNRPRRGKGSIPACAGEPGLRRMRRRLGRVYPRVCGGAGEPSQTIQPFHGLSPRVRGSRIQLGLEIVVGRSIPACAGEPHVGDGQG